MNFLPYGNGGTTGWIGAFGFSAAAHVGIVAGMITINNQMLELVSLQNQQAAFDISVALEQLEEDDVQGVEELTEDLEPEDDSEFQIPEDMATETLDLTTTEDDALAEAEGEALESVEDDAAIAEVETEALAEVETEELAAVETETLEVPEEEALPEVEEVIAAPEPEVLEPEPVETAELTPEPVQPEPEPVVPLSSSPLDTGDDGALSPLADTAGGLQTIAPVGVATGGFETNLGTDVTSGFDTTAVVPTEPDVASVVETLTPGALDTVGADTLAPLDTGAVAPVTSTSGTGVASQQQAALRPPSPQEVALTGLIRQIRVTESDRCLAALPRRDGADGVGLSLMAASDSALESFSQTLESSTDVSGMRQTRALLDERQCAAVSYVRNNADYPATRLGLRLDAELVESGNRLTGVVRGTPGRFMLILMIDDNGVVQDLTRFTATSGDFYRFDVPVTREGPGRDTKNMILALAFTEEPDELRARAGQLAQDVFSGLPDGLASGADMAVATFDVR